MIFNLQIGDFFRWHGLVSKNEVHKLMEDCQILIHTSLRDSYPGVIMEALAYGMPVICFDHESISEPIDDKCGIKIKLTNPKCSISDFAEAIRFYLENPEAYEKASLNALKQAKFHSWENRIKKILEAYREIDK